MPHDIMSPEFSLDGANEILSPLKTRASGILSAFSAASEAILKPIKRAGTKAVLSAMLAAAAMLGAPRAKAQQYTYQNLTLPCTGFEPTGINNAGLVVGNCGSSGVLFNLTTNTYELLSYPGSASTGASGVNDNGQVVGTYENSGSFVVNGYVYSNGEYTTENAPNSLETSITGINNSGTFVGFAEDPPNTEEVGFVNNGSFDFLSAFPQGFYDAYANAINNNGLIAGTLFPSSNSSTMTCAQIGNECGFILNGTNYTIVDGPGPQGWYWVTVRGINDSGQFVGFDEATSSTSPFLGFVSNGTTYTTVTPPACPADYVTGINNAGAIVGWCASGSIVGFLAVPVAQSVSPETLGAACDIPGGCDGGDPITIGTGNVFEQVTDYTTVGQNPLSFTRSYNSLQSVSNPNTFATTLGTNWRSNYDRYLNVVSSSTVTAERADGQVLTFTSNGSGGWTSNSDVDVTLANVGATYTLKDHNDTVESYTASGTKGTLNTITLRDGYTQTLAYTGGLLTSVTDSYSRKLILGYSGGLLETVTTPDTLVLTYGFTAATGGNQLTSVSYNTSPVTSLTYQYTDTNFPFALTGVLDEKGQQFSNWTYDTSGRGVTSERGGTSVGADLTTLTYNANGTTTVTNALGVADTYTFTTLQGVPKVTNISRAATSTTAAATETFGYDTNGYVNSQTDWNGNQTTYTNDAHGDPTQINYAVGSPVAYSVGIQYDPTFVHLPHIVTAPGVTSTYARDGNGNPLSRTDVDTTTTTVPYVTTGQSRETQWTWSGTGEELSVQLPRTDVTAKTQFGYDSTGALTSIKDALNHTTQITQHTPGGLPLTVVDPNNVTTTLAYDARLNLHTSTLQTTAGNLVTTWNHDPANQLQSVVQPDNSQLTYGYDTAHRLTSVADLLGNTTTYTLDALGGATLTNVTNPSSTVTLTHSAVFDALDRITSDIGGVGQTTKYAYDPMGNVLTITPPLPSGVITQTPDALNRLATRTDPAPGGTTTFTYDPFNRPLAVEDANSHTTSYVNDGFGDRIQTASPDSGTSVFYFNPDRDLTKSVLPGSLTMNATFDALDRPLANTYTGDTTLSVSRTYDQATGHGFGVGRLTSATDQVGSLSLTYDERGNVTNEVRTPTGLTALNTSTTYDAASNVASITYPDGNLVTNIRNSMGEVTSITSKPSGSSSATNIVTGVTYEPLPEFAASGTPPVTALTFGNGLTGTYHYDKDYRPTTRVDKGATVTIENLAYAYFANNSVKTITDAVNAANTQTLGYDNHDRLTSATSGTGGYGTYGFTWDPVNNPKTETVNGTTTTYHLATGTNRMSGFVTGSTTETIASSPTGNMTTFKQGTTTLETLAYNKANELASATVTSPSETATYAYDRLGRRLKEVGSATSTSTFQYDRDNKLLTDTDGAGNSRVDYVYLNDVPIGTYQPSNNKFYFISTDRLGTPVAATDSTKAVQWSATYQPFGNTSTGASGIVQNLRLPGQEWDLESTFNHNGFRNYAATLTRYVESDPIGLAGGMNTYQYAKGNPFKHTDRRGLQAEEFAEQVADLGEGLSAVIDEYGPVVVNTFQNYANQLAAAVTTNSFYQAATNEGSAANFATGMICGGIKSAVPGAPIPTVGNPGASDSFELLIDEIQDLANDLETPSNNLKPSPPSAGKMSYPAPKMSFPGDPVP